MTIPTLPPELVEELNKNKVVIFVGDALDDEVVPSMSLASALVDACGVHCPFCVEAGRCQRPYSCIVPLTRAAQIYQSHRNTHALNTFVKRHLESAPQPNPIHRAIAELPIRTIVTTAYDDHLYTALKEAGRRVSHITRDTNIPYDDPEYVQLIRLRGTISQEDTLVLTEDDAADFSQRLPNITITLQAHFNQDTLLFLGYQLNDPYFLSLYRPVIERLKKHQRLAYAVQWPQDDIAARRWRDQIYMIVQKPLDFLSMLNDTVQPRKKRRHHKALPPEPYKFLDWFTSNDTAIFYGREKDTERLISLILANPLTILYGELGTGKTSLIQAAVLSRLGVDEYHTAYARPLTDPLQTTLQAIRDALPHEGIVKLDVTSLHQLVEDRLPINGRLLVVLDQFEEFFIRQGPETREQFIRELVELLHISNRDVRCLISLRSDFLDRLDELEVFLGRDPLQHRMRLYNLGPAGARDAISKPAAAFDIKLDPALVEQLIIDLQQEGIAPPQLQIVCYVLWQDWLVRQKPADGLTLTRYFELGQTTTILSDYLDNVIKELAQPGVLAELGLSLASAIAQIAAQAVLKGMITAERTKVVVSGREITDGELVAKSGIAPKEARILLDYLGNKRIIRRLPDFDHYELAHEVMVDKVWEWFSEKEREMLDLRDMLARATSDYRKFGTLLSVDRLTLLTEQSASLSPGRDALKMLLVSAIEYNLESVTWVSKMESDYAIEVLIELLNQRKRKLYPQIARALGHTHSAKATRYLQELLQDESNDVQRAAVEAMVQLDLPVVVRPLYYAAQREENLSRAVPIIDALERIHDDEATSMLILTASEHPNMHVRSRATNALARLGHPQSLRLFVHQLLNSADASIRQDAIQVIKRVIQKKSSLFQQELTDSNPQNRLNAIEVLKYVQDNGAVELLLFAMLDGDMRVRREATIALGRLGDKKAVKPLLLLSYEDENAIVQKFVTDVLWQLKDKYGIDPLTAALQDENVKVRIAAANFLGQSGDERAIEPLIIALHDENVEVRIAAANCLGRLRHKRVIEPLIKALQDENQEVRLVAVNFLKGLNDERVIEPVIVALQDKSAEIRVVAAQFLSQVKDERVNEPLLAALQDEDAGVRVEAANFFVRSGDERAIELLITALQDESVEVRIAATSFLGKISDERVVAPLITVLTNENTSMRQAAATALGQSGNVRAIEPLIAVLTDENSNVRQVAVEALGQLGDTRAVEPLIAVLNDKNKNMRKAVAKALGQLGDVQAVGPLIATLKDDDADVRQATVKALGQLGDAKAVEPLITNLADKNVDMRRGVVNALGQLGDARAVKPLVAILADKNADIREAAVNALVRLGDTLPREPLLSLLQDSNPIVRAQAADVLGQLKDERAVAPLLQLLQDPDPQVRAIAAGALGRLKDERAVAPLLQLLQDPDSQVRTRAAAALGYPMDARAVAPLLQLLQDPDPQVRTRAAAALGRLKHKRVAVPLLQLLQDPDPQVRAKAASVLGRLKDERAVTPLLQLLQDTDAEVRTRVAAALGQLKDARAVAPLLQLLQDPDPQVRTKVAAALGQLKDARAVAPLLRLLQDPDPQVHTGAVAALAQLKSEQAVVPLLQLLQDPDPQVRAKAAGALGQLKDARAVAPLLQLLQDTDAEVRTRAAGALGQLKDERAVEPLMAVLQDDSPEVRHAAVAALRFFNLKNYHVLPLLITTLQDKNVRVRRSAALTIGLLGSIDAIESLQVALEDQDPIVRERAATALKMVG